MKITVDPDALVQRSDDIRMVCNDLNVYMQQIETIVLSIGDEWKGDAERAYTAKLFDLKQKFSGITGFLEEYSSLMEETAGKYEEFDKELSSKINLA